MQTTLENSAYYRVLWCLTPPAKCARVSSIRAKSHGVCSSPLRRRFLDYGELPTGREERVCPRYDAQTFHPYATLRSLVPEQTCPVRDRNQRLARKNPGRRA